MATLTIRNLDEDVKREIRKAAAERGVSMEQEVRDRLTAAFGKVAEKRPPLRTTDDILRMVRGLRDEKPLDPMYKELSHKELTDALWDEEPDR